MKISYNWLKTYVDVDLPAAEVAEILTFCGLEVESFEKFESIKGGLAGLVVGEVLTCEKHPDADKLSLTTVEVGTGNPLQIVCGAPNVGVGQKVIVALIGAKLYPTDGEPFEIKKSKIRGQLSEGMICAEDEIGIGQSHAGIMVLPADTKVGTPAADYFKIESDIVFEIGLTPNRVDAASHIGVARDLAAVIAHKTGKEVQIKLPDTAHFAVSNQETTVDVEVLNHSACARYCGISISNLQVADSPDWLKHRLQAIGVKPINNVVDITNYVLHEFGQPLHAFDASKIIGNKVVVKTPTSSEKFVTLDGIEREITTDDLMICNASEPMCIAGVYGGLHSGVSAQTTAIFLESAYFDAAFIRKTSKYHNLKTDASFRFERGTDPDATIPALKRAAQLLQAIAGGVVTSKIIDVYPVVIVPRMVELDLNRCATLIGKKIDKHEIVHILKHLGIKLIEEQNSKLKLEIPLNKVDVYREADVIEEILRIYGYNQIEIPDQMRISLVSKPNPDAEQINKKIRKILSGIGFQEILNNSLTSSAYAEKHLGAHHENIVKLLNPLSSELDSLRQSMVFGALETIRFNVNRKQVDLKLFEAGKVYAKQQDRFVESNVLSIVLCGNQYAESWNSSKDKEDYFRLKGVMEALFHQLGLSPNTTLIDHHALLSYGLQYQHNTKEIAVAGMVKSQLLIDFDIQSDVFYAQVLLDDIYKPVANHKVQYTEVPKYPEVRRDLALLIDEKISFAQIEQIAKKSEKHLLKSVSLFDVYQGKNLEPGKKSYAVSFTLQDTEATLNDKQIDKVMSKLIKAYEEELGAVLRG